MATDQSVPDLLEPALTLHSDLKPRLVAIRRHLHMHPELGMQEVETSRFIRETLEYEGFAVKGPLAETGLYVDVEGEHPGPVVAYRADIDALPIQDAKEVPYCSQRPGVAHLCGHDAHTAVAIGIALELRERRSDMHGTVRVFFQPNEEGVPSGAPLMIRDGVLQGVEAVFGIHVDSHLPVGKIGISYGPVTAASDHIEIEVVGTGTGHSARPHEVVDTIWVATQILNTLYQICGRVHDVRNSAILTMGMIHAGSTHNVIPDRLTFGGTVRCIDAADRIRLRRQISQTAQSIATLYGAQAHCHISEGAPAVVNTPALARLAEETTASLFGDDAVVILPRPSMGAEDFAYYLDQVPGAFIRVGSCDGPDTSHPLHDARFDLSEDALPVACKLMSEILLRDLRRRTAP